jgi:hypothetical protein
MARINQAKNATSNAFIAAKRRREEQHATGLQEHNVKGDINLFEEQHHHLLSCLESATVSSSSNIVKKLTLISYLFSGSRIY